jgi:succinate dehydrogenase / fumarate reductase membrane anchor subunit
MTKTSFLDSRVKINKYGSAKSGSHHWWMQRFTAIILAGLTGWMFFLLNGLFGMDVSNIIATLKKPQNIIPIAIFVPVAFYHAALGMKVIFEDYIKCKGLLIFAIVSTQIFSLITVIAFLVSLLYIMVI